MNRPRAVYFPSGVLVYFSSGATMLRPYPPDRNMIDVGNDYANFSRIHSLLGWKPRMPLRDGLAGTLEYYRKHLDRYL